MIRFALRHWRLIATVAGLVSAGGLFLSYRAALIEQGQDECQAKVQRAIEQQQALYDQNAAIYESGRAERQVEYRDRVREVVKHVESDSRCDWSPRTFGLLNDAITGAEPAGEPGAAVPGPTDYRITQPAGDSSLDRNGGRHVPGLPGAPPGDR